VQKAIKRICNFMKKKIVIRPASKLHRGYYTTTLKVLFSIRGVQDTESDAFPRNTRHGALV
jgi:hypothetical protein